MWLTETPASQYSLSTSNLVEIILFLLFFFIYLFWGWSHTHTHTTTVEDIVAHDKRGEAAGNLPYCMTAFLEILKNV